ncbi:hypothetical protein ADK70_15605 [Streptomyces rimosus subsp. pseudoverticillatus]|uniref:hypothetical protein n=1 Tax=Streptomyces rimosus TaxID=1927 RepID=UPI0006B2A7DD|nr:hypothetical protein [Streptomyces rimosus]KOT92459.1 hypothetical protein ADK70_15605 [Streptomyces rimosus subsp. pseudoverticillatus]
MAGGFDVSVVGVAAVAEVVVQQDVEGEAVAQALALDLSYHPEVGREVDEDAEARARYPRYDAAGEQAVDDGRRVGGQRRFGVEGEAREVQRPGITEVQVRYAVLVDEPHTAVRRTEVVVVGVQPRRSPADRPAATRPRPAT